MVATTSGTTTFSLDVDDIIEQALEPLGGDYTDAAEQQKARRALNLVLIELSNKGIPLHKIDNVSVSMVDGTAEYTLSTAVSDVLEATLKTTADSTETTLDRYSLAEYHEIPNKTTEGRPTLFATDRQKEQVVVKVWSVPDENSKWTLELLVSGRIEDVTASYQRVDLPYRYYPLVVAWLSYKLSLTRAGVDENMRNRLKMDLNEILKDTFEEDRERTSWRITPGGISGR